MVSDMLSFRPYDLRIGRYLYMFSRFEQCGDLVSLFTQIGWTARFHLPSDLIQRSGNMERKLRRDTM